MLVHYVEFGKTWNVTVNFRRHGIRCKMTKKTTQSAHKTLMLKSWKTISIIIGAKKTKKTIMKSFFFFKFLRWKYQSTLKHWLMRSLVSYSLSGCMRFSDKSSCMRLDRGLQYFFFFVFCVCGKLKLWRCQFECKWNRIEWILIEFSIDVVLHSFIIIVEFNKLLTGCKRI